MVNKEPFNIAYQSKGLDKNATEESTAVVKDTYRSLKKRNKFFNFQASFFPLQGHVTNSWTSKKASENAIVADNLNSAPYIKFCGITYKIRKARGLIVATEVPIIRKLSILRSMLIGTNNFLPFGNKISKEDVLTAYAEDYYEKINQGRKILPNELMVSWYAGIVLTCIFYGLIIWALYMVSPLLALSLLMLHIPILIVYTLYVTFNKF